jgi:hypothetical protein
MERAPTGNEISRSGATVPRSLEEKKHVENRKVLQFNVHVEFVKQSGPMVEHRAHCE